MRDNTVTATLNTPPDGVQQVHLFTIGLSRVLLEQTNPPVFDWTAPVGGFAFDPAIRFRLPLPRDARWVVEQITPMVDGEAPVMAYIHPPEQEFGGPSLHSLLQQWEQSGDVSVRGVTVQFRLGT